MSGAGISAQMESCGYQLSTGLWGSQPRPTPCHPINQPVQCFPLALANLWSWFRQGRQCLHLVRRHRWLCSWHWVSQGGLQGVLTCHHPPPASSGTREGPIRENHHMPAPHHAARTSISQTTPGYKLLGKENEGYCAGDTLRGHT